MITIAYDLVARLRVRDENFSSKMRSATGETRKFKAAADDTSKSITRVSSASGSAGSAFQRMGTSAGKALSGVASKAASAATSIAGIGAAIGTAAAGWAAFSTTKEALKLSSDAEIAGIAFETMLGSADKAQQFLGDLKKFAADTPFDLPGLRDASRRLLATGVAAEGVIPMLTTVGDAAAGLGLRSDGIDRITLALSQMSSSGRVTTEDMNQLTDVGIQGWTILASKMKISTAEVRKLTEQGLLPADKAVRLLLEGMDDKFGGMTEKQAKTLDGMRAKMEDVWDNDLQIRWGDGIATALYPRFKQLTTWIDNNGTTIERWGTTIANVATRASEAILRKIEGAYKYVNDRYIDNARFKNLSVEGKVSFVISDLLTQFNGWLKSDGGKQITDASSSIVKTLSTSLLDAAAPLSGVAYQMGTSLASGVISGFQKAIEDHPILSSLIGAGAGASAGKVAGPWGVAAGAVSGGLAPMFLNAHNQTMQNIDRLNKQSATNRVYKSPMFDDGASPLLDANPLMKRMADGSHSGGLDRVPYNGYVSVLHKDERVQTKAEADEYRSGKRSTMGGSVMVTGNTFIVRQESDIDAIARSIAQELGVITP